MNIKLVEPSGKEESFEGTYVHVLTHTGDMGIFDNHTASMLVLKDGPIEITTKENTKEIRQLKGGLLTCDPENVYVLADHVD